MFEKYIDPNAEVTAVLTMCDCPQCNRVATVEQRGAGLFCSNCSHSYLSVPRNSPELTMIGGGILAMAGIFFFALTDLTNELTGIALGLMLLAAFIVMTRAFIQTLRQRREMGHLIMGFEKAEEQGYEFREGTLIAPGNKTQED